MYFLIHIIALFGAFLFGSTLIARVGNYSELNPKDCGLSRLSSQVNTNCFKWHKHSTVSLKRGKNVTAGDAPWVVLIELIKGDMKYVCGGTLFADQWILTAAHCLIAKNTNGPIIATNIKVFFGHDFLKNKRWHKSYLTTIEQHLHPKAERRFPDNETLKYDLALLKLNQSILDSSERLIANSICLPIKGPVSDLEHFEYVMIAGWGGPTHMLKMGYWKMFNGKEGDYPILLNLDNQTACQGDSGIPVWQYDMGRAVLAAVAVNNKLDESGTAPYCQSDFVTLQTGAVRVDWEIDWIRNVTKLN